VKHKIVGSTKNNQVKKQVVSLTFTRVKYRSHKIILKLLFTINHYMS